MALETDKAGLLLHVAFPVAELAACQALLDVVTAPGVFDDEFVVEVVLDIVVLDDDARAVPLARGVELRFVVWLDHAVERAGAAQVDARVVDDLVLGPGVVRVAAALCDDTYSCREPDEEWLLSELKRAGAL